MTAGVVLCGVAHPQTSFRVRHEPEEMEVVHGAPGRATQLENERVVEDLYISRESQMGHADACGTCVFEAVEQTASVHDLLISHQRGIAGENVHLPRSRGLTQGLDGLAGLQPPSISQIYAS